MFLSFSTIFLASIESLMWSLESMFWRLSSIKDFLGILDTKISIKDKDFAKKLSKVAGNIVFDKLYFSYDGKRNVIENVSFDVKK
jgi:ATP-binding cassette subfamily B protein